MIFGRAELKWYYYTGDDGFTYSYKTAEHLGAAAGLVLIPDADFPKAIERQVSVFEPRYVWAKEAVPSQKGSTKRVKLIVQADSPLYKTTSCMKVEINGVLYLTTGRVGERFTWGAAL